MIMTGNVETDLDLTNGTSGDIVEIMLHEDEEPYGDKTVVKLKHLPRFVLVKLTRKRAPRLVGLEGGEIPVELRPTTYNVAIPLKKGGNTEHSFKRRQFPLTTAYSFKSLRLIIVPKGKHLNVRSLTLLPLPQEP